MAQNYRTDLDHLNKLCRINKAYNSPKIISNYPEIKNPKKYKHYENALFIHC